jgi:hypothetical protein
MGRLLFEDALDVLEKYDDSEPRDEHGRWSAGSVPADTSSRLGYSTMLSRRETPMSPKDFKAPDATREQRIAVKTYGDSGYVALNRGLAGKFELNAEQKKTIATLDGAIGGSSTKKDLILFRGGGGWGLHKWSDQIGRTLTFKPYISASASETVAGTFSANAESRANYQIFVPKGAHALSVEQATENSIEREVILPHGSRLHVDKVDPATHTVWLRMVA